MLGSQMFITMPFFQLYPALICTVPAEDMDIDVQQCCSREQACASSGQDYSIDWNERTSLENWTTELNLVCEAPYTIGLMGIIALLATAAGSILFGSLMD